MTDIVQEIYLYQPPKYIHFITVGRKTGDFKRDGWLNGYATVGRWIAILLALYRMEFRNRICMMQCRVKNKRNTATQNRYAMPRTMLIRYPTPNVDAQCHAQC